MLFNLSQVYLLDWDDRPYIAEAVYMIFLRNASRSWMRGYETFRFYIKIQIGIHFYSSEKQ